MENDENQQRKKRIIPKISARNQENVCKIKQQKMTSQHVFASIKTIYHVDNKTI